MFPAASVATSPTVSRLPFYFLVTGTIYYLLLNVSMFGVIPSLTEGNIRGPWMWTAVHSALLGWGTMIAMGAMYQLVPVALQIPIYSEKYGYFQYLVYTGGVLGLLPAFFLIHRTALLVFGVITLTGILMFVYNMAKTIKTMPKQTLISAYVLSALAYLLFTVMIGFLLVLNLNWNFLGRAHQSLYAVHILTGLVGWFTLLIIGFSFKMVPMFTLSHGYGDILPKRILLLFHGGILLAAVAAFSNFGLLWLMGQLPMMLGFLLVGIHLKDILSKRMKKRHDTGLKASLSAFGFGLACFLLLPVLSCVEHDNRLLLSLIYLFIYGWISLSIAGYLYKIFPFLWWTKKYGDQIGKIHVPQLKDLISESLGRWIFALMIIGICGFTLSIFLQSSILLHFFQTILLAAVILFVHAVFGVFRK